MGNEEICPQAVTWGFFLHGLAELQEIPDWENTAGNSSATKRREILEDSEFREVGAKLKIDK
jgi:hypothetical protein